MHGFAWEVHDKAVPGGGGGRGGGAGLPIAAVPFNTGPAPGTPWAPPGAYTVKLTVNGRTLSQPLTVIQDPRVKPPAVVMLQVYALSTAAYREAAAAFAAAARAQQLRDQIAKLLPSAGTVAAALTAFDKKVEGVAGAAGGGGRGGRGAGGFGGAPVAAPAGPPALSGAAAGLSGVMDVLQSADVQPTAVQLKAIATARAAGTAAMARWTSLRAVDLAAINLKLKNAGLAPLTLEAP